MIPLDVNRFNASIRSAFLDLSELQLTDWGYSPQLKITKPNDDFRKVAFNPEKRYEKIFLEAHRLKEFNIRLMDGALFQFWISSCLRKARFAFLPCPFEDFDFEIPYKFKDSYIPESVLEEQLYMELESHHTKPIIRYDYDEEAYIPVDHPASHLTIGLHTNSRWPVKGFLTPELFCLLIVKQYYELNWHVYREEHVCRNGFLNKFDRKIMSIADQLRSVEFKFFSASENSHCFFY